MIPVAKRLLVLERYFSFCSGQLFWFMLFDVIGNDFVLRLFLVQAAANWFLLIAQAT